MVAVAAAPRIPLGDKALGAVAASSKQTGIVVLRPSDQSALTSFIAAVTDKSSSLFHQYLAPGAFAQRFGPSQITISAVKAQLSSQGLRVTKVSRDGLLVSFAGSAAAVEAAFRTGIERYRLSDGSMGQATTSAVRMPSSVASSVEAVVGLDTLFHAQPADIRPGPASVQHGFRAAKASSFSHPAGSPSPCTAAVNDAEISGGLTDDQIANAYGAFGLYRMGDFGRGQHIAVYELQPFLPSDMETFDSCFFGAAQAARMSGTGGKLAGSLLSIIPVDGGEPQPGIGSQNDEATLDIQDVSAIAPQASIDVYEAPNTNSGGLDEYAQIVNNDTDQIVTSSWAACEQLQQLGNPGVQQAESLLFQQAAAQGQTILSAAGDTGNDECNGTRSFLPPTTQNLLSVLDPGSQPYVLSVGGSTIDNAAQPALEHVWDDGAQWGAGGGGISESWAMPSWQRPVALTAGNATDIANAEAYETKTAKLSAPNTTPTFCVGTLKLPPGSVCRETPDISAQADEFTGSVTIYGRSLGYGPANGWATIGGTSSATPIWAGLLALVNASPACSADKINGIRDVGFASPILYGIAADPTAYARSFNDIVAGNNDGYGLDNGLAFPARAGYDMASGLGTPQLTTPTGGNALAFYMCDYAAKLAPPTVSGLSPTSGSTAGGYTVTVTGSGFGTTATPDVASVQVGSTQASGVAVVNDTTLTAVFPPATAITPPGSPAPQDGAGPAVVGVTLKSGESSFPRAAAVFDYVDENMSAAAIPSVTSVGPSGGLESSPKPVTIYGSGFTGATQVTFGGVAAAGFDIKSPNEIVLTPPAYSAQSCAPLPTTGVYAGEDASNDVCQVEVVVTNANGSSAKSTILPPYEGPISFDSMGGQIIPPGYEATPQPTEFDYAPAPSITSVSTGSVADLKHCIAPATAACNAIDLASEFGGLPTNLITLEGTGMNGLSLNTVLLGTPFNENSVLAPVAETGTSLEIVVPLLAKSYKAPTTQPVSLGVEFASVGGTSNKRSVVYAGVPKVASIVNSRTGENGVPDAVACTPTAKAGCGTALQVSGTGLLQAVGPIAFVDNLTGFSLGTQYNFAVKSDAKLTTQSVAQNPGVVDVEICTVTSCSYSPATDVLFVYPPGTPRIDSMTPATGPAHGGNQVVLNGSNLGCVVAVAFGQVVTLSTNNSQALLTCGTTNQVVVTAPPGKAGAKVPVRLATVESFFNPTGKTSNSISYTYSPSVPSGPTSVTAMQKNGGASVSWGAPASDGGSPVTGYIVTASSPGLPSERGLGGAATRHMTFNDLQAGATWTFSVKATSKLGVGLRGVSGTVVPGLGADGYLVETQDGSVLGYGDVHSHGGIAGEGSTVVGFATTPDGLGYWIVTSTGAVTPFGDATYLGEASRNNVVGIASMPSGKGYWIATKSGAVQAFGQARTYAGKVPKGSVITAIAPSLDGKGYWLVGSNGSVTAFGDAPTHGSLVGKKVGPVVAIAVNPAGKGYWLATASGSVFAFGGASRHGSVSSKKLSAPIVGMAPAPAGDGYWLVAANGQVYNFGAAKYLGSAPSAAAIGL